MKKHLADDPLCIECPMTQRESAPAELGHHAGREGERISEGREASERASMHRKRVNGGREGETE